MRAAEIGGGMMTPMHVVKTTRAEANVRAEEWLAEASRQYSKHRYSAARAAAAVARAWAVVGGSTPDA